MKTFSPKYKIVAFLLVLAFTFQTMETINSHTYKIGVETIHTHPERMSCLPSENKEPHINFYCPY